TREGDADSEGDDPQRQWSVGVGHCNQDGTEAPIRPRHIGLDATAEHRAVPAFGLAGLEPILGDAGSALQFSRKLASAVVALSGSRFRSSLTASSSKPTGKTGSGSGWAMSQPSSSPGSDPKWRSNSSVPSRGPPGRGGEGVM